MIAEPFFLTQYAEKAGSGTTDMIDACHRAGLPTPEFRTDPHRFVTILYRAAKKAGANPGNKLKNRAGERGRKKAGANLGKRAGENKR